MHRLDVDPVPVEGPDDRVAVPDGGVRDDGVAERVLAGTAGSSKVASTRGFSPSILVTVTTNRVASAEYFQVRVTVRVRPPPLQLISCADGIVRPENAEPLTAAASTHAARVPGSPHIVATARETLRRRLTRVQDPLDLRGEVETPASGFDHVTTGPRTR
ncbi:hypothetical protein [Nocardioides abyssi]|uniref:Uncharacterized protein n=1 Tax=Nocardioides abyssi TaxID=3058370 RepID=A0ABT8ETX2_9ACTN|nr:hypothetical protein [Nocardioides abyssi]MDN4161611.1 hypothetical protein [Nocardioides abyssi]